MSLAREIDPLLPLVSKPTRYLGNEFHVVKKTPVSSTVQWCLILPEVYEIGMSHWGLRILYDILNRREDALAERCFTPWVDMEAQMRRRGVPLFSLESKRPVREFDFVGFSLQYELTYTNLLTCLDLAGIPLRAEDRDERHPLVIAGGPCVSNPEPSSDFIDLYLIGDAEEAIHTLTDAYKGLRGRPRQEILRALASLPGIYVPLMYEAAFDPQGRFLGLTPKFEGVPARVQRQFVRELETAAWPEDPIVPLQGIAQDRLAVEVLRGCTQGCRFCQAGYLYRPIRERSPAKILEMADRGIRRSGWSEVGLVSLSTADYTQLPAVADLLNARFGRDKVAISLPSLRADSFGVEIADRVRETRKTGFTFAPEAGSERLRLAVNKNIRDEEFFAAAQIAYERGWRLIKMYFMVGLPTETMDDVRGIVNFVDTVRRIGRTYGPACAVNASVGAFVPKSHTPFQWDRFEEVQSLREKIDFLRQQITGRWSRLKWHDVQSSHLEAVFSTGDRRLGRAIERAYRDGARFDGWTEHFNYERWMRAFEATGIDPAAHTRSRAFTEALPWDHIDIGLLKKWLVRERKKTEAAGTQPAAQLTADCRHGDCTACGIPGLPNDTQLSTKLPDSAFRGLMEQAAAGAPPPVDSSVLWPVRILFEKTGPARFLSHLELGTVLARAFRMARVPLAFSQGHHPHPKIAFGPPLPVGIEGLAELFDADLLEPWSDATRDRLNAVLPEGLRIRDGKPIPEIPGVRRTAIAVLAQKANYALDLSDLPAETRGRIVERIHSFQSEEICVVERTSWYPPTAREVRDWETQAEPVEAVIGELAVEAAIGSGAFEAGTSGHAVESAIRHHAGEIEAGSGAGEVVDDAVEGAAEDRNNSRDAAPAVPRNKTDRNRRRSSRSSRPDGGEARRVDLKQAIVRLERSPSDSGDSRIDLELRLAHRKGQVANPRVVLQQLFSLSPEEQARVRVVRTTLLEEGGNPLPA